MSYKRIPWGRIFLGIVVVAVGVPCLWLYPDYKIANAFTADDLRGYEDKLTDGSPPRVSDALPPRSGKVVLMVSSKRKPGGKFVIHSTAVTREVRKKTKEVEPPRLHDAMYDLDASIRASSPEEVGTVIFCEDYSQKDEHLTRWEDEHSEYYMTIETGRRNMVTIYVYDLASGQVLGAYIVKGPPAKVKGGGYDRPDPVDLVKFISDMPER